jgi:hypothetical protein
MTVTIGIDIGQKVDPTAIAVLEKVKRADGEHYIARFLQRLPLTTPYPAIAERLGQIVGGVHVISNRPAGRPRITTFADATGVGQPVVDLLRLDGVKVVACYFTHGDRRTEERVNGQEQVSIGKAWLVSRLQALLQTNCLHLPRTPEAALLAQELLDYEIKVSEDANDRYGAFRVGAHDDLVTALGLAAQGEKRRGGGSGSWLPSPDDAERGPFPDHDPWRL